MAIDLKSLTLAELEAIAQAEGWPKYRARQIASWLLKRDAAGFEAMTDLPDAVRRRLAEEYTITRLTVCQRRASMGDTTVKLLLSLNDGHTVEAVLLRQPYGCSACVSTQVGCRMGCLFCASTLGGRVRDLTAGEILDQVMAIQRSEKVRVSRVVIMGTGEPLDNFEATMTFVQNATAGYGLGIGGRHITLSTCGLVPGIRRLAALHLQLTLAVSLHAPNNRLRDRLVPVNRRYPLQELIPACRDYAALTGRRVTFEYTLIKGINDRLDLASELTVLLRGVHCHVNLIPVNPVVERGLLPPDRGTVQAFRRILETSGLPVTVRKEMGAEIGAACGQLRRGYQPGKDGE